MKPKVSIIVPIYNMEKYLSRCMDSLLHQSYVNLEVIAVNDGSQDMSLAILERYARKDGRVVVINQPNSGVSAARNAGLLAAEGQFIGFVDPDDWLERTMFEELVGAAVRERADIVMCGYIREFGTHSRVKKFDLPHAAVSRGEEIQSRWMRRLVGPLREELAQPDYLDAWGTVWNKLYRSAMLKDKALKFIDLHIVGRNEDTLFNIHAFSHAEAFVFINRPLYHYWRVNSASITSLYNPLLVEKFEQQYRLMETFIDEHRLPSEFRAALSNRICMNIVGLGLHIISAGNPASLPGKIRSLRRLVARPRFREALKGLELAYCAAPWRIFFTCARLKLPLSLYIMLKAMNAMRTRSKGGMSSETGSNSAGGDRDESGRTGNDDHELLQANGSQ